MARTPNGTLTDAELHIVVHRMQTELPALGQTMVWGRLGSMVFLLHVKEFDVLFMTLILSKQLCVGDVSLYVVVRILCQDPTHCGTLVRFL